MRVRNRWFQRVWPVCGHGLVALVAFLAYLLLNRPEVILPTTFAYTTWFPAAGLAFAVMLGISPRYLPLFAVASGVAGVLIYHQSPFTWSVLVGAPLGMGVYAYVAHLLRTVMKIDTSLAQRRDVIWDFAQPSLGGLDVMRKVREYWPEIRIIVLSWHFEPPLVRGAVDLGVSSYVLKSEFENKIELAVAAASGGLRLFDRDIFEVVAKGYLENPATKIETPTIFSRLTGRELEIVRLLTLGSGNRQVAVKLGIRVRTVESHRANIMRKLNIHTLTELIHLAVGQGIIQIPSEHSGVAEASSASR